MQKATNEDLIAKFHTLEEVICESCEFHTTNLNIINDWSENTGSQRHSYFYCDVCCSTHASKAHRYPSDYAGELKSMAMMAYCTNTILQAIETTKK